MTTEHFPNQFTILPHDGEKVLVAGQELAWHALDSANFNVKLFRFAYGLNKVMNSLWGPRTRWAAYGAVGPNSPLGRWADGSWR